MSTLISIAGKNGCGGENVVATGKKGCQIAFGTPKHALRLKKGTKISPTTEFNTEYILELIQKGIVTPLMGATAFERLSGEDGLSTTTDTTERLNVLGLPKYKLTFQEGHEWYRQISELTGFNNSDWLIIDDSGNLRIAIDSKDNFVGFKAGQVIADQVMEKVQGGDGESKSVNIQFTNRKQWDLEYTIVTQDQHGIDWEDISGANPVNLTYVGVLADAASTMVVSALLASDNSTPVEGLTANEFLVVSDEVPNEVTGAVENSPGLYTLTLTSAMVAAKKYEAKLGDFTLGLNVASFEGVLYSSEKIVEAAV